MNDNIITLHPEVGHKMMSEGNFKLFRHEGMLCCIIRMGWSGNLNGYVAVESAHPFYEKGYHDHIVVADKDNIPVNGNYIGLFCYAMSAESDTNLVPIDIAINVHGGITFSGDGISGIEPGVLGNLWWFGFDTSHCDDIKPLENHIDRQYRLKGGTYKDMEYTVAETKKLAEQLAQYGK
jgi:hypothetical protein